MARPGFFGWLQSALRDRTSWRAVAYSLAKAPLVVFGVWFALSTWLATFTCLTYPIWGTGATSPHEFGVVRNLFPPGYFSVGSSGFWHGLFIVVTGVLLLFVAPWTMRLVVFVDRSLMRALLSPDAVTARMRTLEQARARTVDASAAILRRIERDLHDGTQAQLVALAMRLGQAKEKLAAGGEVDLDQVRRLVDDAHRGAKEAIVELRDLARGIHPPVLDVGLEGALSTLAARSALPTDVTVTLQDRPTPAIEAIAYFCVAELLANVAQHSQASRASVSCVQHGAGCASWCGTTGGVAPTPSSLAPRRAGSPALPNVSGRGRPSRRREPAWWSHCRHRRPPAARMSDTIRVAIAEDSAVLRDGLVQLLADRGFVITDAVGAADGSRRPSRGTAPTWQ